MPRPSDQPQTDPAREREIFLDALERAEPLERAAFLERACGDDAVLRASVESLLQSHRTDAFLETPAFGATLAQRAGKKSGPLLREKPGDVIGEYKLLEQIGEGGCGVVYMAQQESPVRRKVALKIIKFGMDTRQVIARFEAERQALALMDHPNIARVFDGGTTESGRPFFVMELVQGVRVTDFSDQNQLSTQERLKLFVQVCHAIQHAHQKGVIHRDIKPSNILVTLHDGVPVPKVIDFGIAKAVQQPLTDKTLFTHFQSFIGTPAYTSPEQAEMSGLDIDTRSDIYSLGVLLYQLLTGQTPFDPGQLTQENLDEFRRIVREEEPKRPSTRLSTLGMAEATALVANRQTRFPILMETLRGDLDWIVLKCLEKDRSRRYETASALALDVKRFLDDEPVSARRPSRAYQLRKFVRRNRVVVSASVAIAVLLLVATTVSGWLALRATRAEREERQLHRTVEIAYKKEARLREQAQVEQVAALRRAYNSDMNLVQQALGANNFGRVVDLLNQHRPTAVPASHAPAPLDLRQWEWRYFWTQSRSEAKFALPDQPRAVSRVALSPDARLLLCSSWGGSLQLWDLAGRTKLGEIPAHGFGTEFSFSHDGAHVALVQSEGPTKSWLRLWSVGLRQIDAEILVDSRVEGLTFSPDDRHLLIFSTDNQVRAWDLSTRELQVKASGPHGTRSWPRRVVFSPDASSLAILERDQARILSVETGEEQAVTDSLGAEIRSVAFSPDGAFLAAGPSFSGTNSNIGLFSARTGKSVGQFIGHVSWVPDLVFTADGKRLISAGADQTVRIWDVATRQELAHLRGHRSEIYAVAVSQDGQTAVTGCKDGSLNVWDCGHLHTLNPYVILPETVLSIAFFPDGRQMLTVNHDHTVTLWSTDTLEAAERVQSLGNSVERLVISPDGSRVYANTRSHGIRVLDWTTRAVITNLVLGPVPAARPGFGGESRLIGIAESGCSLVVEAPGHLLRLLNTRTWQMEHEWNVPDRPFDPSVPVLSPDQRWVALTGTDSTAQLRTLNDGALSASLPVQERLSAMAFSPDSRVLATSSVDGTVELWDTARQKLIDVLRGHLLGIESVTFSPDGQRLATTSHGNEAVKLWDVQTRHEVATLSGAGSLFRQVHFSPDGQLLVAVNVQGQAHVWRAPSLANIDSRSTAAP